MQTYREAAALLPAGAVWSSSFGYPGEGGYAEYHKMPDGRRWIITNGAWNDPVPDWQCKPAAPNGGA